MKFQKAGAKDVEQMKELIEEHARMNKMLPRSLSYLYENLRDYIVAIDGENVVGCVALHISWKDLAEIKSLAVKQDMVGQGIGRQLLEKAVDEAKALGMKTLFTLTLEPEFFEKNGFKRVQHEDLPMKVWGECIHCPKYPECDEIALEYTL